jgi:RNA polymerase sigma-70 factor (ECF subfamily)
MGDINRLIERWQAGDEWAAEELYNLHRQRTYYLAYGLLGNTADAQEAAQDALTYALLNISRYDPQRSKFTTWLHMITVGRCRDIQRKRRLPTFSLTALLSGRQDRPAPDSDLLRQTIRTETRSEVWQAVKSLSPSLREAIVLRHWGGYTYREIGDIIGCPMKTAQSRVRLAYQRLEKELTEIELQDLGEERI